MRRDSQKLDARGSFGGEGCKGIHQKRKSSDPQSPGGGGCKRDLQIEDAEGSFW